MMTNLRGVKYFFLITAFFFFLVAGYTTTSVITSRQADAQFCMNQMCNSPIFGNYTTGLLEVSVLTFLPALGIALLSLFIYYSITLAVFLVHVLGQISYIVQKWSGWWDTFWYYNMGPAMQDMTAQLSAASADQARAVGSFVDMTNRQRQYRERRKKEVQRQREQRPSETVCAAGTVMSGMMSADTFSRAYNAAAGVEMMRRGTNDSRVPSSTSSAADMSARYDTYLTTFCDPNENGGNVPCTTPAALPGMDRDVTGLIFSQDTVDVRDNNIRAAVSSMVSNITEPSIMDPLPNGFSNSPAGVEAFLKRQSYTAKRQAVSDAVYHVISRRVPGASRTTGGGVDPFLDQMRNEAGVSGGGTAVNNPSKNEVMQVMANDRYRTGRYALRQIDEPVNNAKELVVQEALQTLQMVDMLNVLDRYALVLAARVGDSVKATYQTEN